MSAIVIRREVNWRDTFPLYEILIDGVVRDSLAEGETRTIEVEPGHHEVQFRAGKCTSAVIGLMVGLGRKELIECGPPSKKVMVERMTRWFSPKKYIRARRMTRSFGS
jgi:hypothetical protein